MGWPLLTVGDLTTVEIEACLARAESLRSGTEPTPTLTGTLALLFFEQSTRTRVAWEIAAYRLGLHAVGVYEPRATETSHESWADSLRVVADLVDVVVARPDTAFGPETATAEAPCPLINGGDRGPLAEHPTQALADLFAIRALAGDARSVTLIGDPRMRAARSLIRLLDAATPYEVSTVTDSYYLDDETRAFLDAHGVTIAGPKDVADLAPDVLYVIGMPHLSLPIERRNRLIVSEAAIRSLPDSTVVLSPMPVIDEIDEVARRDGRIQFYQQSRLALFVRMALLISALDPSA